jgi:putative DNA primase/helicase
MMMPSLSGWQNCRSFEFDRARKVAAEKFGVRASILDKLVAAKRAELGLDQDDGKQGRAIAFPEPEMWPQPVDGINLLNALAATIRAYVVIARMTKYAIALWAVHSYLLNQTIISPRLAIRSPTKQCGKTTLIDVLSHLVLKPLRTDSVSPSALFRVVAAHRPTILIDEADAFARDNDELRGILNSGHRQGGHVLRNVGDEHEPRAFATYAATAIATIGTLPDTLIDRAVIVDLKRRLPREKITPFRLDRTEVLDQLARQIARWARDNAEAIAAVDPKMPPGIVNRAADNWRPLVAIADVVGGRWPARIRRAILASAPGTVEEASQIELLLGDIRDTFDAIGSDLISSESLVEKLTQIEGRQWAEFGRSGKPISQNKLARLLKRPGINVAPKPIRVTDDEGHEKQVRGYERALFEDAFARFLPEQGGSNRLSVTNPITTGTSDLFQTVTAKNDVTVENCEKSNNDGLCDGVTVGKGGNGHARPNQFDARALEDTAEWYLNALRSRQGEPGIEAILAQALGERLFNRYDLAPADVESAVEQVKKRLLEPLK